jgi:hypothetical protein
MNKLLSELLGTFILVFAGTGAIVINDLSGGVIGHAGIALTFGLVVMAMIYTYGDVSGAHLNPAVTIAFANPRTRRGLFRALFTLAHRAFGPEARKSGLGDTGFDTFFRQALILDDQSVQHCIDKEIRRKPTALRRLGKSGQSPTKL